MHEIGQIWLRGQAAKFLLTHALTTLLAGVASGHRLSLIQMGLMLCAGQHASSYEANGSERDKL
jgi:hypothetical protein